MIEYVLSLYDKGGPVIAILAVLSVVALSVILQKLWHFTSTGLGRHEKIREAMLHWKRNQGPQAIKHLQAQKSPAAITVRHALQGLLYSPDKQELVREDIDRVAGEELAKARKGIRLLETIAQIAPLLGLFGTILGMIEAFQALQGAGASVDPSALAGGIWIALLTTAAGLALAIPTTMVATWLDTLVEAEQQATESMVTSLLTSEITAVPLGQPTAGLSATLTADHANP
jgi:biopolymer transport protein ExbB